jgi:hypothetical protein
MAAIFTGFAQDLVAVLEQESSLLRVSGSVPDQMPFDPKRVGNLSTGDITYNSDANDGTTLQGH